MRRSLPCFSIEVRAGLARLLAPAIAHGTREARLRQSLLLLLWGEKAFQNRDGIFPQANPGALS